MFNLLKLVYRVIGDTSQSDKALDSTGKKAGQATDELSKYVDKFKEWAAGFLTISSVAAGVKKVWVASSQVADLGDQIDKASQKFMLSRQAYQEWAYVAERSGFSIEQLGQAAVDLSKKVGDGKNDTINGLLEEIGIDLADALTATPEELFDKVIAGLQGMENSTRKAYVADQLLGGAAKDLGPLLNSNAEDTQALKDQVHQLGGVMSDTLIDTSAEYKDSLTNLNTAWQGVKNQLAENTLPGMIEVINGLTQVLTGDFVGGLETSAHGVASFLNGVVASFVAFTEPLWAEVSGWMQDMQSWSGYTNSDEYKHQQSEYENGESWWVTEGYDSNPDVLPHFSSHANGIPFIPRDNYPARLHYGERVLTRQENESYSKGQGVGGNTTINIQTVAQSPAQTAAAITAALARARWAM